MTAMAEGPLTGLRVLDFTIWRPGPYATQLLAELGADVLKVEPPSGDDSRGWLPFAPPGPDAAPGATEESAYFLSAAVPGPAEVAVQTRRAGGSISTASAELRQGGETRIAALATYGDLSRRSDQVARWLRRLGVGAGDRVIVMLNNTIELWELLLALLKIRAVAIPTDCRPVVAAYF